MFMTDQVNVQSCSEVTKAGGICNFDFYLFLCTGVSVVLIERLRNSAGCVDILSTIW